MILDKENISADINCYTVSIISANFLLAEHQHELNSTFVEAASLAHAHGDAWEGGSYLPYVNSGQQLSLISPGTRTFNHPQNKTETTTQRSRSCNTGWDSNCVIKLQAAPVPTRPILTSRQFFKTRGKISLRAPVLCLQVALTMMRTSAYRLLMLSHW